MANRRSPNRNRNRSQGRGRDRRPEPIIDFGQPSGSLFGLEVDPQEQRANRRAAQNNMALAALLLALLSMLIAVPLLSLVLPSSTTLALAVIPLLLVLGFAYGAFLKRVLDGRAAKLMPAATMLANARVATLLDALTATMGVAMPRVLVIDDAGINAASLIQEGVATVWLTRGLVEIEDLLSLEGALAHELAVIKTGLVQLRSVEGGLDLISAGLWTRFPRPRGAQGNGRAMRADMIAAAAVRYPRGLLSTLELGLSQNANAPLANLPAYQRLRAIWLDPSIARRSLDAEVGDRDATSARISALREW
ncbi:MAG: hypothetical protein NT160_04095 [Actinobacteria bacterium]|nr:hypothetical protein [Actinomycetota bacterium]